MKNWRATILSQYDNSPRLLGLIEGFNALIDPEASIDAFYAAVFDPRTATGWGLDVWGRIVGVDRAVTLEGIPGAFGFDGSGLAPFGQGPFWNANATTTHVLADEAFRLLIFMKAAINITDGTLAQINRLLSHFFAERGQVMALHVGTMRMRLVFRFMLKTYERAILAKADMTPIPAGVGYELYDVPLATFGFAGSGLMPFGEGAYVSRAPLGIFWRSLEGGG